MYIYASMLEFRQVTWDRRVTGRLRSSSLLATPSRPSEASTSCVRRVRSRRSCAVPLGCTQRTDNKCTLSSLVCGLSSLLERPAIFVCVSLSFDILAQVSSSLCCAVCVALKCGSLWLGKMYRVDFVGTLSRQVKRLENGVRRVHSRSHYSTKEYVDDSPSSSLATCRAYLSMHGLCFRLSVLGALRRLLCP